MSFKTKCIVHFSSNLMLGDEEQGVILNQLPGVTRAAGAKRNLRIGRFNSTKTNISVLGTDTAVARQHNHPKYAFAWIQTPNNTLISKEQASLEDLKKTSEILTDVLVPCGPSKDSWPSDSPYLKFVQRAVGVHIELQSYVRTNSQPNNLEACARLLGLPKKCQGFFGLLQQKPPNTAQVQIGDTVIAQQIFRWDTQISLDITLSVPGIDSDIRWNLWLKLEAPSNEDMTILNVKALLCTEEHWPLKEGQGVGILSQIDKLVTIIVDDVFKGLILDAVDTKTLFNP